jgi:hypothetical protein
MGIDIPFIVQDILKCSKAYLGDKVDEVLKVGGVLLGLEFKDGPGGLKVTKLLEEFFFVREGVSLDEVLELRDVGGQQCGPVAFSHGCFVMKTKKEGRWTEEGRMVKEKE